MTDGHVLHHNVSSEMQHVWCVGPGNAIMHLQRISNTVLSQVNHFLSTARGWPPAHTGNQHDIICTDTPHSTIVFVFGLPICQSQLTSLRTVEGGKGALSING